MPIRPDARHWVIIRARQDGGDYRSPPPAAPIELVPDGEHLAGTLLRKRMSPAQLENWLRARIPGSDDSLKRDFKLLPGQLVKLGQKYFMQTGVEYHWRNALGSWCTVEYVVLVSEDGEPAMMFTSGLQTCDA